MDLIWRVGFGSVARIDWARGDGGAVVESSFRGGEQLGLAGIHRTQRPGGLIDWALGLA
jgi:hypothetical protein